MPKIASSLVNVDDFIESLLSHVIHQVLHVEKLFLSEVVVLGLASPEFIIGSLEFYPVSQVVSLESRVVEFWQIESLSYDLCPFPQ